MAADRNKPGAVAAAMRFWATMNPDELCRIFDARERLARELVPGDLAAAGDADTQGVIELIDLLLASYGASA